MTEDVRLFQEFNILNMKIAGLDTVAQINKGGSAEEANSIKDTYVDYRETLINLN